MVLQLKLLIKMGKRKRKCFPTMKWNPLDKWNRETTEAWMREKKRKYGKYKGRFREKEATIQESSEECDLP